MVLNSRLAGVAEEEGLMAEKQEGFRKQRGCRDHDQVLSLVLLGQMEMLKKVNGMMVAFIDFSKAHDMVDRGNLWGCLKQLGVNGTFLDFLQSLYQGTSCQVRVGDMRSRVFKVIIGLHQGCVLSPLLFLLYINGLPKELKEASCGVNDHECCGAVIPGLLFADDTSLLASDEPCRDQATELHISWENSSPFYPSLLYQHRVVIHGNH